MVAIAGPEEEPNFHGFRGNLDKDCPVAANTFVRCAKKVLPEGTLYSITLSISTRNKNSFHLIVIVVIV